ncbi:hypothetical protein [Levilactobacillus bambusae]|uniref:Uncharacterized protein n=1 Tax=Levilactobacillus bambusae TaxID=2024736 RepID=A0A2V1MY56_9LACO|nr:hypothetical protein [Levilactobacillus bambusae]PWF99916.1 hypothetical protein DCM90_02895 [Levilactobacillus bambusae]
MNRNAFFDTVQGHWWKFSKNGHQNVIMGGVGILAIEFQEEGYLSYPSKMGFLPNLKAWTWDNERQLINFLDANQQVQAVYQPPVWEDQSLILMDTTSKDKFYSSTVMERTINDRWAPAPILASPPAVTMESQAAILIRVEQSSQAETISTWADQPEQDGITIVPVQANTANFDYWQTIYWWLSEHSYVNRVGIITHEIALTTYELMSSPKVKLGLVEASDKHLQGLIGSRSMLMELSGEVLFRSRVDQLAGTPQTALGELRNVIQEQFMNRTQVVNKGGKLPR